MLASQPTSVILQLAHAHQADLRFHVPRGTPPHGHTARVRLGTWMVRLGMRIGGGALRPVSA